MATRKEGGGAVLGDPALARPGSRIADVGSNVRFESELPTACRCLTALVAARHFDCRFEWAGWAPEAETAGVPADAIEAAKTRREPEGLPEEQALVVAFGIELLETPHRLTEPTFQAALEHFGAAGR